jgi:hypothetical protein
MVERCRLVSLSLCTAFVLDPKGFLSKFDKINKSSKFHHVLRKG